MQILDFYRYRAEDRLLHGGDYNPDQWLNQPDILANDISLMGKAKTNTYSIGIFAWAALEPEEGVFNFRWLDEIIDKIDNMCGNVILATPSGARPAWLSQKYPEVLRTNSRGEKMRHGERHNHCFSSPIYRKKVRKINRKLAMRYGHHPALLMWHISNEYSGECYCNYCKKKFRKWIKKKYVTLDALNQAYWSAFWSHTYTDFSQVEPPSPIGENSVHALNLDWKRFVTHQTIDFYLHERDAITEIVEDIPITTNMMGDFYAPTPFAGLDYAPLAKEVDIISWDAYPPWHNDYETTASVGARLAFMNDYFRTLKNQPFLILESTPSMVNWQPVNKPKRPGMHMLSSVACLAHGADSIMYFQWRKSRGSFEKFHGAVVDHDNSEDNRVFKDVKAVGEMLAKVKEIKNSTTPAKVALLYDVESMWALDDAKGFDNTDKKFPQTIFAHYTSMWNKNIPVDVITPDRELSKYALIIAPMLYMASKVMIKKLKNFVHGGGRLVSTYISGMVDENDLVYSGGFNKTFGEIFGINVTETDSLYPKDRNSITGLDKDYEIVDYCALIDALGAEVLATYGSDFYKGTPAVTKHNYGNGRAYFIGARTQDDFLQDFYDKLLTTDLTLADVNTPPITGDVGVSIQTRIKPKSKASYYFVMNFTEAEKTIILAQAMTDIVTDQEISIGEHKLPPYGTLVCKVKHASEDDGKTLAELLTCDW